MISRSKDMRNVSGKRTLVRRQNSFGEGYWEVVLEEAKQTKSKNGADLIKLVFKELESERQGTFIIPMVGSIMDQMIDGIFGDKEDEIYLEDMLRYEFGVHIERNGNYLNIKSIEALQEEYEDEEENIQPQNTHSRFTFDDEDDDLDVDFFNDDDDDLDNI